MAEHLPWNPPAPLDQKTIREFTEGRTRYLPGAPRYVEHHQAAQEIILVVRNEDLEYLEKAYHVAESQESGAVHGEHGDMALDYAIFSRVGYGIYPFGDTHVAFGICADMGVGSSSWPRMREGLLTWAAALDIEIDIRWPIALDGCTRG